MMTFDEWVEENEEYFCDVTGGDWEDFVEALRLAAQWGYEQAVLNSEWEK